MLKGFLSSFSVKKSNKKTLGNWDESDNQNEDWMETEDTVENVSVKKEEEHGLKKWLRGEDDNVDDESVQKDLEGLKQLWTNPNLPEDEKFLRDYILNDR